jgi:hypothetical protein
MSERPTTAGNGAPTEAIEPIRSGTLRPTMRDVTPAASVKRRHRVEGLQQQRSPAQETPERVIAAASSEWLLRKS